MTSSPEITYHGIDSTHAPKRGLSNKNSNKRHTAPRDHAAHDGP